MQTTKIKTLEFFSLLVLFFLVLYLIYDFKALVITALCIGGVGLFFDRLAFIVYAGWSKLAQLLAFVITQIILSLIFFLVLYPISLLYRMLNRDPLKLSPNRYDTLYETRAKVFTATDIENMW